MSGNDASLPATVLRLWLTTDAPASGWQAACGRFYRGWRAFARNPLGLIGLAIFR